MLNKEVCKRCMATTEIEDFHKWELKKILSKPVPWIEEGKQYSGYSDDKRWEQGDVMCPNEDGMSSINNIPKHCKYALEQTVIK